MYQHPAKLYKHPAKMHIDRIYLAYRKTGKMYCTAIIYDRSITCI
jgi:hypothetical protein